MAQLIVPHNFRITNRDTSPLRKTRLEWDAYTGPELAGRIINGFRIYRSVTASFAATGATAGTGNCIADENTLGPSALVFEDGNIPAYGVYFYEIRVVGMSGYGLGQYGNGTPYGSPSA